MNGNWIDRLRRADEQRPSFPGEHWLVATAGMWFLRRKGLLSKAAGAAMLYRAASGRDGLRRLLEGGGSASRRPALAGTGARSSAGSMAGSTAGSSAGSSYEPRGNPATSGYPDFR